MNRAGRYLKLALLMALLVMLAIFYIAIAPKPTSSATVKMSPAPTPTESASASAHLSPSASKTPSPSVSLAKMTVSMYYVGKTNNGLRLYREFRSIMSTDDIGLNSLQTLVKKRHQPLDKDYSNLWGNGSVINYIRYSGSKAIVDIAVVPLNVGAEAEMRAIDQLVWTLTANHPSTSTVRFTSGGKAFESFAGHVDARHAFSRELPSEVLAPVWVDQLASVLTSPVTMRGAACTFEAGVYWQLFRNGALVQENQVLASGACPVRGGWSVNLGHLRAGNYRFVAQDISAQNNSVNQKDSKEFTIR